MDAAALARVAQKKSRDDEIQGPSAPRFSILMERIGREDRSWDESAFSCLNNLKSSDPYLFAEDWPPYATRSGETRLCAVVCERLRILTHPNKASVTSAFLSPKRSQRTVNTYYDDCTRHVGELAFIASATSLTKLPTNPNRREFQSPSESMIQRVAVASPILLRRGFIATRIGLRTFRAIHTDPSDAAVRKQLRGLLRETAQPVAVVTSLMPESHQSGSKQSSHHRFHGATLSSFTSIAMDPHPLVAFSLRIPSRMATQLKDAHKDLAHWPTHMVVNILSALQTQVAVQFSRVDLHPHPFEEVPYSLTEEGLPILNGSLGALSCKLVASSWPLHDLDSLRHGTSTGPIKWEGPGVASELFIAQVTRVEAVKRPPGDDDNLRTPLIYRHRTYETTSEIPTFTKPPGSES